MKAKEECGGMRCAYDTEIDLLCDDIIEKAQEIAAAAQEMKEENEKNTDTCACPLNGEFESLFYAMMRGGTGFVNDLCYLQRNTGFSLTTRWKDANNKCSVVDATLIKTVETKKTMVIQSPIVRKVQRGGHADKLSEYMIYEILPMGEKVYQPSGRQICYFLAVYPKDRNRVLPIDSDNIDTKILIDPVCATYGFDDNGFSLHQVYYTKSADVTEPCLYTVFTKFNGRCLSPNAVEKLAKKVLKKGSENGENKNRFMDMVFNQFLLILSHVFRRAKWRERKMWARKEVNSDEENK